MTVNNPKALAIHRGGKGAVGGKALAEDQGNKDQNMALVKRPVGLVNLGNTCFMNAALQCLSRTPGLMEKLELLASNPVVTFSANGLEYNAEDADGKISKELKLQLEVPSDSLVRKMVHLLKQMTEGTHTVNPRAVHCVMAKVFGAGLQHDSHELLRHVLDKLKKDQIRAFRVALMDMFGIPRQEASKMLQSNPKKALEVKEWDRKLFHVTVIDDLFGGELVTTRTCLECKTVKTSREEFLDLSLPIRVMRAGGENKPVSFSMNNRFSMMNEATTINRTLFECLRCFTEPETLSGNNCVDCEKCHELKLAEVKAGKPIEEVFPQPPPAAVKVEPKSNKGSGTTKKYVKTRKAEENQKEKTDEKPQNNRRRKKRKTRAEKVAEDQERAAGATEDNSNDGDVDTERQVVSEANPGANSGKSSKSNSDVESGDQDKAADEGYAEDFKETDDSSGVSARSSGDNDADRDDPVVNDDKGDDGDEDDSASEDEHEDEAPEEEAKPPEPVIPKSTKSACSRQTMVAKPPRILTVHFKRFTVGSRGYTCKLSDHVQFDEYIDIRDYVNANLPFDDDDEDNSNDGGPISPGSWSFEDLNTKEQDVLGGASGDDGSAFVLGPLPLRLRGDVEPGPSRLITAELNNPAEETCQANVEKGPEGDCDPVDSVLRNDDGANASSAPELVQYGPEMKGSEVLFEFDTNDGNAETSELQPILDISPISRSGSAQAEAEQREEDCKADAEEPAAVDDLSAGIEDMDDEPPPYPGSPTFDEDEIPSASRVDPELPLESDWTIKQLGSDSVDRWIASGSLDGDYDKVTEDPPADPFDDLNAKRFGSSLFLDEAETLRAPLDSCNTTYSEDARHRLPSYSEVVPSIDSPAANIWGSTVTTPMVTAKPEENDAAPTLLGPENDESKESILGFEDNFEPAPAPPPLPPIALGYEPLNDHNVPVVVQDFEKSSSINRENVVVSKHNDETSGVEDVASSELEESKVHPDPNGINYRLYGIVEHGGSLNWGHYIAYIRVGSDWYYISDSSVSNSNISTVLSRDPYILFYERI